jgi:hypothetical protein
MERLDGYFRVLTYRQQQDVVAGRLDPQKVTGLTYASSQVPADEDRSPDTLAMGSIDLWVGARFARHHRPIP